MKIAICYFGMTGFADGKVDDGKKLSVPFIFKNNLEKLIEPNNADVYVHSWSQEAADNIIKHYQPKNYIFEPVKHSSEIVDTQKIRLSLRQRLKNLIIHQKSVRDDDFNEFYRASSRWLSTKKSIELALSNSTTYDVILSIRLDVVFNRMFLLPENLSQNELLVSHWNDAYFNGVREKSNFENYTYKKRGFLDLWFAGSIETMQKFCEIYEKRYFYSISPHASSFEHCMKIKKQPRFELYRGWDYELYRRQFLHSQR